MAMRRLRTGYVRRHRRDAVGFIWFTLLALPLLMLSMGFAADFTRLVMVGHQMRNVADAGAIAAAWQVQTGTVVLDEDRATAAAQQTVCEYSQHLHGVTGAPTGTPVPNCPVPVAMEVEFSSPNETSPEIFGEGYRTAEVTVDYRVTGLIFPGYFGIGERYVDGSAHRAASVCIPGDADGFTGGYCERPVGEAGPRPFIVP